MERVLVLASSSPWRRQLLERLGLPFLCQSPDIDETPLPGETVRATALRLSEAKARALAGAYPDALVIGSDQVASLHDRPIGKPGNHAQACQQLAAQSGQVVDFHTGLCLLDTASGLCRSVIETTRVHFRPLSEAHIEHYLRAEQPYGCAGSFRAEGLGIALFERIESRDPTALVGLPLIALCGLLKEAGMDVLDVTGPAQPSA